jgi:hypothetical protein
MLTKVAGNALRWFECVTEPCDAKNSWYAENVQVCVMSLSQPLDTNAKARPACCLSRVNYVFETVLQGEVGRCEIGRSRRPQNLSVLSYLLIRVVIIQKLFFVVSNMSRSSIMHKPHSLSRCQRYSLR